VLLAYWFQRTHLWGRQKPLKVCGNMHECDLVSYTTGTHTTLFDCARADLLNTTILHVQLAMKCCKSILNDWGGDGFFIPYRSVWLFEQLHMDTVFVSCCCGHVCLWNWYLVYQRYQCQHLQKATTVVKVTGLLLRLISARIIGNENILTIIVTL